MKRIETSILLLLAAGSGVFAQNQSQLPLITVSGSAVVRVVPNEIDLSLGVETRATSLQEAQQKNETKTKAVVESLKASGVEAKDLQIDFISVEPSFGQDDKRKEAAFYAVKRRIAAKVRDVTKFETALTASIKAGATQVEQFEYQSSDLRKHRDAARSLAVRAAKEKAQLFAKELGVKVGKAHSIQESTYNWANSWGGIQNNLRVQASGDEESDRQGMAVGMIGISARVEVSFLLE